MPLKSRSVIALEPEEHESEKDARIKELEQQHEADARRLSELEQQNAALRSRPLPEPIKVLDPEHAAVRQQNANLSRLIEGIADSFRTEHERAVMAIRVIRHCSADVAKAFVPMLGFTYAEYARMLSTYKTEYQLKHVIDAAEVEGPAVIFAKAALALRDDPPVARCRDDQFVPDSRSGEEKLREAKALARQPRLH